MHWVWLQDLTSKARNAQTEPYQKLCLKTMDFSQANDYAKLKSANKTIGNRYPNIKYYGSPSKTTLLFKSASLNRPTESSSKSELKSKNFMILYNRDIAFNESKYTKSNDYVEMQQHVLENTGQTIVGSYHISPDRFTNIQDKSELAH